MKKTIILSFLISLALSSFSQIYTRPNTSYGTIQSRIAIDSAFLYPTNCGTATLRSIDIKKSAFYFDSCAHRLWVYDPKTATWDSAHLGRVVAGGGGGGGISQVIAGYGLIQVNDSSFRVDTSLIANKTLVTHIIDSLAATDSVRVYALTPLYAVNDSTFGIRQMSLTDSGYGTKEIYDSILTAKRYFYTTNNGGNIDSIHAVDGKGNDTVIYVNYVSGDGWIVPPQVVRVSDYVYDVTDGGILHLGGSYYNIAPGEFNIDSADGTDRLDDLYGDTTGNARYEKGTPAEPILDPSSQFKITTISVPASGPPDFGDSTNIYLNNNEWTVTNTGTTTDPNNTTAGTVFEGTKSISISNWNNGDIMLLTAPGPTDILGKQSVNGWIKLKQVIPSTGQIRLQWKASGGAVGNWVILSLNKSNITTYQPFSVNMASFGLTTSLVTVLQVQYNNSAGSTNHSGAYVDDVYLQAGITNTQTNGGVTSVGLTMPSAFTVVGSPVTGAGNLTVTGAGTTLQYIRGDGSLGTLIIPGIDSVLAQNQFLSTGRIINLNGQTLFIGAPGPATGILQTSGSRTLIHNSFGGISDFSVVGDAIGTGEDYIHGATTSSTLNMHTILEMNSTFSGVNKARIILSADSASSKQSGINIAYDSIAIGANSGKLIISNLPNIPGTKSLRYNPSTGLVSYGDTTGGGGGFTNPMTSPGDMIYGGTSGTPLRLPMGNSYDDIMVSVAGNPSWQSALGRLRLVKSESSSTSVGMGTSSTTFISTASAPAIYTLPTLSSAANQIFYFKNAGSSTMTIQRTGSDQLWTTSAVTSIILAAGEGATIVGGSSYWHILSSGNGGIGAGSVTSVSQTSGFGISSSVANSTTTPNITIGIDSASSALKNYLDARSRNTISSNAPISYNNTTGIISADTSTSNTGLATRHYSDSISNLSLKGTTDNALIVSGTNINLNKTFTNFPFSSTTTLDLMDGYDRTQTMTGDEVITPSNQQSGDNVILIITQDGTGGHEVTFDTDIVPTDPASGAVTVIGCVYDGVNTIWHCTSSYNTYLTSNQTITLSGNVTGSGTTAITTAIANNVITNAMINSSAAIANSKLANSAITINGISVSLGGTRTLTLASSDFVNQGTTTTVLHGNASGNPSFGQVVNADLAGSIAASKLIGTDITTTGTVTSGGLGTGAVIGGVTMTLGSDATGDIYYRNSSGILTRLGVGTSKQTLHGGTIPIWLDTAAAGAGGFSNPMTTLGDIMVENSTPAADRLAGNTAATKKFLTQTGNGTISSLPGWNTIVAGDIPDISATYEVVSNKSTSTSLGTSNTLYPSQNAVKVYIDNAITASNPNVDVQAATTTTLPAYTYSNGVSGIGATITFTSPGALVVDGYTFSTLNERVLIKNETSTNQPNNGVYYVTTVGTGLVACVLTRTLNYDQPGDINGTAVFVINGTTNGASIWAINVAITTVGTDNITYTQIQPPYSSIVTLTGSQTLTNKTLTSPAINTPTGIVKGDIGLGNVDNTSDATKNAASVTLTNKTLTSPVINTPTGIVKSDVGLGNVDNTSDASKNSASVTLTNHAITPRVTSIASSSTPTPTASTDDQYNVTALAANATFGSPGSGVDGQVLTVRIKDNGTARTLAFNAIYRASSDLPLPSTTIIGKTMYLKFVFNNADTKWDFVGFINNF